MFKLQCHLNLRLFLQAFQELSGRMMSYENNTSRNCAEPSQPSLPVPSQGSSRTGLVGGGGGPPGPEDPYWEGDDSAEGDEEEELLLIQLPSWNVTWRIPVRSNMLS